MTIYRPTVAQDVGGDHSINKADLITKFRIEVVQQQIRSDPARPLQDIVVNSGFRSVYAASRLFHRKYGESLFDYYAKYKL